MLTVAQVSRTYISTFILTVGYPPYVLPFAYATALATLYRVLVPGQSNKNLCFQINSNAVRLE